MGHMHEMMAGDMAMMHDRMGSMMPMTGTMPMHGAMGMMNMGMIDMASMQEMMGQMQQMMKEMHQMHQMMGMGRGPMDHTTPMTTTASPSDATTAPLADLTQIAQIGPVEIVVTPANIEEAEAATLDFTVAFNSHTEEIDIDLAKSATLMMGDEELAPAVWETDSLKGHHIKGILRFARESALVSDATEMTLTIGGLPGGAEYSFTWALNVQ
jgi:hypothetical protein